MHLSESIGSSREWNADIDDTISFGFTLNNPMQWSPLKFSSLPEGMTIQEHAKTIRLDRVLINETRTHVMIMHHEYETGEKKKIVGSKKYEFPIEEFCSLCGISSFKLFRAEKNTGVEEIFHLQLPARIQQSTRAKMLEMLAGLFRRKHTFVTSQPTHQ